jgi:amino acid adenylation domain-containing protein
MNKTTNWPQDPLRAAFQAQVRNSSESPAVQEGAKVLSYTALDSWSNRCSGALLAAGASTGQVIAIWAGRSAELVPALVGVRRSGAAICILDSSLPAARLAAAIATVKPKFCLRLQATGAIPESVLAALAASGCSQIVDLPTRTTNPGLTSCELGAAAPCLLEDDGIEYVLFTSGSTGTPKAVTTPRRCLSHFLGWYRSEFDVGPADRFTLLSGLGHDPLMRDVVVPLTIGASLGVPPGEALRDPLELVRWFHQWRPTVSHMTPTLALLAASAVEKGLSAPVSSWRYLFLGGEGLTYADVRRLRVLAPHAELINGYGTTETPQLAACYRIGDEAATAKGWVPVGHGIADTRIAVVDPAGLPVPANQTGEVLICTPYLASGYLDNPELTAQRFVHPSPRVNAPEHARAYRTGDMGVWDANGTVTCLGRKDNQVKVRGFRVELGEVEAALRQHPAIKQAVVVAREDAPGDKRLVAYFVRSGTSVPDRSELRALLKQTMPDYMVPADYVVLDAIPISPNGKTDRNSLAQRALAVHESETKTASAQPRNDMERKLVDIFRQVLKTEDVGIEDDFFDLGGHSLTAVQAILRINAEFGVEVPVRVLFQAQTVAALASVVQLRIQMKGTPIQEEWPTVIPIQVQGSRAPLFCVARPNRNALGYLFLSRQLGPDQPLYGLQRQMAEGFDYLDFTQEQYEETAADYIRAMRAIQPEGPYFIVGFCQGSYIAFEMARQLERQGQQIGLLAILDTWREENTRRKALFFAVAFCHYLPRYLNSQTLKRLLKKLLGHTAQPAAARQTAPQVAMGAHPEPETGGSNPLWQLYWPGTDFRPQVIAAEITVFKVARQFIYRVSDPTLGWGNRTTRGVEVEEIPGDHETFLREPHVKELARKIAARITLACAGTAR